MVNIKIKLTASNFLTSKCLLSAVCEVDNNRNELWEKPDCKISVLIFSNFSQPCNCIGNGMICSDIWHKYHEWYFKIVIHNFTSRWVSEIWYNFEISRVVFMQMSRTNHAIICLYYYPQKVCNFIFTCRYFKLSWNTTALNQSNCRNFSCSSISCVISNLLSMFLNHFKNSLIIYKEKQGN